MTELTIFTPTYNRENNLLELYNSLEQQTNNNFIWLIVDDGSTDNTKQFVERISKTSSFKIKYFYQQNSGKYMAHNKGVNLCDTDYFVCIDSDETLENNSVELIYDYINKIKYNYNYNQLLGIIFIKNNNKNILDYKKYTSNPIDIMDTYYLYGIRETVIVIKTDILKKNLMPKIEKEKFASEEIMYIHLSNYGKFYFTNKYICNYEYLNDGLTKNIYSVWNNNFNSSIILFNSRYEYLKKYNIKVKLINRFKNLMNLNAICIKNRKNILLYTPSKFWSLLLFIPSLIWRYLKYDN